MSGIGSDICNIQLQIGFKDNTRKQNSANLPQNVW